MARQVFLSHSGRDTWVAEQIAREMRDVGATTFLDREKIEIGANFEEEIRKALASSQEFVVLLTPWALDRPYIWLEVGAAFVQGLYFVAVLHGLSPEDIQNDKKIPVFIKEHRLVEINDLPEYFRQLKRRVG